MYQSELPFRSKLTIDRVDREDVLRGTDNLTALRRLILESGGMYPGIDKWFDKKVITGLATGDRVAFIGISGIEPVAVAVLKRKGNAKFCHLRITDHYQDQNLGDLFFALMAAHARGTAERIHFTLPESLWFSKRPFFESFGFVGARRAHRQYRRGDEELACSATFQDVWQATKEKLPDICERFVFQGPSIEGAILLSVKPRFAAKILSGAKSVELRKVFSSRWIGHTVMIYSSSPISSVVGTARISTIERAAPIELWLRHGADLGCDLEDLDRYAAGSGSLFAIKLVDVRPFDATLSLKEASEIVGRRLRPPESYSELTPASPWGAILPLAGLMGAPTRS